MARPRKPTALKLIEGNRGKRATNAQEPEPDLLQDLTPPARLAEEVAEVWLELAPKLRRAKLLTELDTDLLELTCTAIANFRISAQKTSGGKMMMKNSETGTVSLSPWAMLQSMTFKQGLLSLKEWGIGPVARSRVMVDPQQDLFANPDATGTGRFFG